MSKTRLPVEYKVTFSMNLGRGSLVNPREKFKTRLPHASGACLWNRKYDLPDVFKMRLTNESNTRFSDESNIMLYVSGDL